MDTLHGDLRFCANLETNSRSVGQKKKKKKISKICTEKFSAVALRPISVDILLGEDLGSTSPPPPSSRASISLQWVAHSAARLSLAHLTRKIKHVLYIRYTLSTTFTSFRVVTQGVRTHETYA